MPNKAAKDRKRKRAALNKKLAKEFVKRVAIANGELKDKEVRFLVRMKHAWGYEHFD